MIVLPIPELVEVMLRPGDAHHLAIEADGFGDALVSQLIETLAPMVQH
jgi:hypothetical protein